MNSKVFQNCVFLANKFPIYKRSFYLIKKNGILYFQDNGGSGIRNTLSMEQFALADKIYGFDDFDLVLVYTDCYNDAYKVNEIRSKCNLKNLHILSYSGTLELGTKNLIPDSYFYKFPQIQMFDYDDYCSKLSNAGDIEFQSSKLGWAGNPRNVSRDIKNISPRKVFVELSKSKSNIFESNPVNFTSDSLKCEGFISLNDQIKKWKYLLDIEGYGYSGRLKYLLFSKRVVFLQDRPWHEWYFHDLVPFKHYIPVNRDLSDLEEKYNWIEKRPEQYENIVNSAFLYAKLSLTAKKAFDRIKTVIINLPIQENTTTEIKSGMSPIQVENYFKNNWKEFWGEPGHRKLLQGLKRKLKTTEDEKSAKVLGIDVGSCIGEYLDNFKELLKNEEAEIFAFEPNPSNLQTLRSKAIKNPKIKIFEFCLSDEEESNVGFFNSKKNLKNVKRNGLGSLRNFGDKLCDVDVRRLDNVLNQYKENVVIKFLKVDTEGNDTKVIKGMGRFINNTKYIIFECSDLLDDERGPGIERPMNDIINYLDKNGFDSYKIGIKKLLKINGPYWSEFYEEKKFMSNCFSLRKDDPIIGELIDENFDYIF